MTMSAYTLLFLCLRTFQHLEMLKDKGLLIVFPLLDSLSNGTPGNTLGLEESLSVFWKSFVVRETMPNNGEIHRLTINKFIQVVTIICWRTVYNTRITFESHPFACMAISAFSFNLSAFFISLSRSTNSKHPGYSQCWWLQNSSHLYLVTLKNTYQDWFLTRWILQRHVSACFKGLDPEILRGIQA